MEILPMYFIAQICLFYHTLHIKQLLIIILLCIVKILSRKEVETSLPINVPQNRDVRRGTGPSNVR